jgi:hypothetical protein
MPICDACALASKFTRYLDRNACFCCVPPISANDVRWNGSYGVAGGLLIGLELLGADIGCRAPSVNARRDPPPNRSSNSLFSDRAHASRCTPTSSHAVTDTTSRVPASAAWDSVPARFTAVPSTHWSTCSNVTQTHAWAGGIHIGVGGPKCHRVGGFEAVGLVNGRDEATQVGEAAVHGCEKQLIFGSERRTQAAAVDASRRGQVADRHIVVDVLPEQLHRNPRAHVAATLESARETLCTSGQQHGEKSAPVGKSKQKRYPLLEVGQRANMQPCPCLRPAPSIPLASRGRLGASLPARRSPHTSRSSAGDTTAPAKTRPGIALVRE